MSHAARFANGLASKGPAASQKRPDAETHAPYEAEGEAMAPPQPSHLTNTTSSSKGNSNSSNNNTTAHAGKTSAEWRLPETITGGAYGEPTAAGEPTNDPPAERSAEAGPTLTSPSTTASTSARARPSPPSGVRSSAEGPAVGAAGGPGRHVDPSALSSAAVSATAAGPSAPVDSAHGAVVSTSSPPSSGTAATAIAEPQPPAPSNGGLSAKEAAKTSAGGPGRPNFSSSGAVPPLQPATLASSATAVPGSSGPPTTTALPSASSAVSGAGPVPSMPPMLPPPPPMPSAFKHDAAAATTASSSHAAAAVDKEKASRASDSYTRPAVALSVNLLELYKMVNAQYCAQRRLESPGPKYNSGYDDKDGHYLFLPGEVIFQRYIAQEVLGKGSFGTVVRAFDQKRSEAVAMKITRRGSSFRSQAKLELDILLRLNENPALNHLVVRLLKVFEWQGHLVLVFELLSFNLYQLIKCTRFNGVSLDLVRKFAYQLTHTLLQLESQKPHPIIHCDLKPENILLRNQNRSGIRLIDFGSACYTAKRFHRYIQSRFYRSPEVILFLEYGTPIDRWSLACVLVELHTGVPLFDGRTEAAQLAKFECTLGPIPAEMIAASPKANRFYYGSLAAGYQLKEPVPERRTLESVLGVTTGGPRGRRLDTPGHDEKSYREFYDFIARFLRYLPEERMSCRDALQHPFLMPLYTSDLQQQQEREAQQHRQQSTSQPSPSRGESSTGATATAAAAASSSASRSAAKSGGASEPANTSA